MSSRTRPAPPVDVPDIRTLIREAFIEHPMCRDFVFIAEQMHLRYGLTFEQLVGVFEAMEMWGMLKTCDCD